MSKEKNTSRIIDKKWKEIFEKYDILNVIDSKGSFSITSKQINEFKEARLMTKFDHSDNLPDLFSKNNLSILPTTRGSYIIGRYNAYQKMNYSHNIETTRIQFPNWLETVDYNNLYSESAVINCAYATGIIQDLIGDDMVMPTVSGRMSSSTFDFQIHSSIDNTIINNISVNNSQCEIDGGYESVDKLILIEAKNSTSQDFLIRQLYYPYRLWKSKISKKVVPTFLTYSNDVFSFFQYEFENPNDYNSLILTKQKNYIIDEADINLEEIREVLDRARIVNEPDRPFPQADRMERVIDLLGILMQENKSMDAITTMYDFDQRQAQYYSRAGMYLGLITDVDVGTVGLTTLGRRIMSMRSKQKYLAIAECILQHKVFNDVLQLYFTQLSPPTINDTATIMSQNIVRGVNKDSTRRRRAQTVNGWIRWILDLVNDN